MMNEKFSGIFRCLRLSMHMPTSSLAVVYVSNGRSRLWYSSRSAIGVPRYFGGMSAWRSTAISSMCPMRIGRSPGESSALAPRQPLDRVLVRLERLPAERGEDYTLDGGVRLKEL